MSSIPTSTKAFILSSAPAKEVNAQNFELVDRDIPELKDDQVLVKTVYLSNDPAQRGWIQKDVKASRLYVPPIREGDVMRSFGIGKVVSSKSSKFKAGDLLTGMTNWSEYAVVDAAGANPANPPDDLSPSVFLGTFGMTGLTAYSGLTKVGEVKKEQTIVISGAAGATGGAAVQICKNMIGMKKVIGIAGGKEKCDYVKSLGADECVDYKSPSFEADLTKALGGEDGLCDVYYDNVGGDILNFMFTKVAQGGKIIACGSIATYNDVDKSRFTNWFDVIAMRITIQGFIVLDYLSDAPSVVGKLVQAYKEKKLSVEGGETIVDTKFEDIPNTWLKLFEGGNQGKLVTHIV